MSKKETCPIQECNITVVNKFIECPFCKFKGCLNCYKYFILNSPNAECMNCKKVWNDDFVDTILPKSFRKSELKMHKENIMFESQEAMFIQTIDIISRKRKTEKIQEKINKLKSKIDNYNLQIREINNPQINNQQIKDINKDDKILIIRQCPKNNCQGYLDRDFTCGICDTVLCEDCEIIKEDDDHECNKDDIESVKIKNKTSKPCPTCSKLTFKISGCSQVWCPPPCNGGKGTPWNFNTGKIDNGMVHSPDYYDYMRKNNNGIVPPQENVCLERNTIPTIWDLQTKMDSNAFNELTEIHRFFVDLKGNVMYEFLENNQDNFTRNLDLRMKYLENEIDKEQFKKILFARNKRNNKKRAIYQNLDMLYNVGVAIYNQLKYNYKIDPKNNLIDTEEIFTQLKNIKNYYNDIITKTKERYDCKSLSVSVITRSWKFSHTC